MKVDGVIKQHFYKYINKSLDLKIVHLLKSFLPKHSKTLLSYYFYLQHFYYCQQFFQTAK